MTKKLKLDLVVAIVLVLSFAWLAYRVGTPAVATLRTAAPNTQAVQVERQALKSGDVAPYFGDPKDKAVIAGLTAQLAKLKADTKAVVVATASGTSTGSGSVVVTGPPAEAAVVATSDNTVAEPAVTGMHFADWRLTFDANIAERTATYTLVQKFETVVTTGRQKDGSPLALAALYELGPKGERVPVPTVQTTAVFADETAPHWMAKLAVQGGVGVTRASDGSVGKVGVAVAQWLKHGRTTDASGVTYALLSPAVVVGPGVTDIGVLPVSVNLGRIPHQPFSNLWLSPFVAKSQRLGVFVTATF